MKNLSSENLKQKLWETIDKVEKGEVSASKGSAIASMSKVIVDTTYLELNALRMVGKLDTKSIKLLASLNEIDL